MHCTQQKSKKQKIITKNVYGKEKNKKFLNSSIVIIISIIQNSITIMWYDNKKIV